MKQGASIGFAIERSIQRITGPSWLIVGDKLQFCLTREQQHETCIAIGVAGLLAACTSNASQPALNISAEHAPVAVADRVKATFFDPYSLRDAIIAEPFPVDMVFDGVTPIPHSGVMVCMRANGKNKFGGYIGQTYSGFLFERGRITLAISGPHSQSEFYCSGGRYQPYQEVMNSS